MRKLIAVGSLALCAATTFAGVPFKLGIAGYTFLKKPLDICGVFRALSEVGYKGVCHLEYERDFEDNAMGLAESIGFYRGVISAIGE